MNIKEIPTIILCGGRGMRLMEATELKPKPMVEIGNKPIIWHIMKIYRHYGFRNFIFALGFKGDHIKEYFLMRKYFESDFRLDTKKGESEIISNNNEDDFNIIFAETGLDTPHGERVLKLKKYITTDLFMVTYGDGVSNIDINKLIEFHMKKDVIVTVTGVHPSSRWGLVNVDENDIVTEFAQKPLLFDYVNGGFMVFKKEFLNYLKEGDMIEDTIMRLIASKQVALYKHEDFWYGMDTYKDFVHLNELWNTDPKWRIWKND